MSRFSYLFSTKNWLIAGACFLMTLEAFRTLVDNVHVVINRTDSLPIKATSSSPAQGGLYAGQQFPVRSTISEKGDCRSR
jgi:hypothetical protein